MSTTGLIILGTIVGITYLYGVYAMWTMRHDGQFRIEKNEDAVTLWYNYQGEWIVDSTHETVEQAKAQIEHYCTARANRPMIRPD